MTFVAGPYCGAALFSEAGGCGKAKGGKEARRSIDYRTWAVQSSSVVPYLGLRCNSDAASADVRSKQYFTVVSTALRDAEESPPTPMGFSFTNAEFRRHLLARRWMGNGNDATWPRRRIDCYF